MSILFFSSKQSLVNGVFLLFYGLICRRNRKEFQYKNDLSKTWRGHDSSWFNKL